MLGPVPQPPEMLTSQNRVNVRRCWEYRVNKGKKLDQQREELNALETKNKELKERMENTKNTLTRGQTTYLRLIKEGKIKYVA